MSETELCPVCGEAMTAAPEGNYECSGLTCPFGLTHTPKSLAYWRAQLAERYGDAALKALVDRLPKTADGKPMFPGMDVWEVRQSGEIRKCWVYPVEAELADILHGWSSPDPVFRNCYSTEEAAKAALEGK